MSGCAGLLGEVHGHGFVDLAISFFFRDGVIVVCPLSVKFKDFLEMINNLFISFSRFRNVLDLLESLNVLLESGLNGGRWNGTLGGTRNCGWSSLERDS